MECLGNKVVHQSSPASCVAGLRETGWEHLFFFFNHNFLQYKAHDIRQTEVKYTITEGQIILQV